MEHGRNKANGLRSQSDDHRLARTSITLLLTLAASANAQPCADIITFETGLTPTREIHVSPSGNNQTGTGAPQAPYRTIAFAAAQATPGAAIRLAPGTYPGGTFLTDLHGSPEAPIWIGGHPGQGASTIISAGVEGLHLVRPRYLIVHDLHVTGASGNGINADDGGDYADPLAAHHIIFRNLIITDIGGTGNQDGLKLSGIRDFWVLDSTIERTGGSGSGSGIDHVGCHRGLIARCTFRDMSGNAVQCKGGSEDLEIRACTMINAGHRAVNMGGSTGFAFFRPPLSTTAPNFEARNIRVVSNLIIGGNTPVAFVGCTDCTAINNTIINPSQWLLRILQETTSSGPYTFLPSSSNTFDNNIVYFSRAQISTYINIGPNTAPETFTFDSNLWYAHDQPTASAPTTPTPETNRIAGIDPGFLHDGVWAIGSTSPAAASGTPLARPSADITGRCRPAPPAAPGRGAYEPCDANCDGSTVQPILNVDDFTCFISHFAAAVPLPYGQQVTHYTNCDRSTTVPVLNVDDFTCFINLYAQNCP